LLDSFFVLFFLDVLHIPLEPSLIVFLEFFLLVLFEKVIIFVLGKRDISSSQLIVVVFKPSILVHLI
jgi:hypothetical protein